MIGRLLRLFAASRGRASIAPDHAPHSARRENGKIGLIRVEQILVAGNQYVRRAVEGSRDDPPIVWVAMRPLSRSGRGYDLRVFSYKGNDLANLMRRHPQLVAESLLQFLQNRLANQEIMLGNHDSE